MQTPAIPPLGDIPETPDVDTKKGLLRDYTSEKAENRVLHINLGFFRYGTDDKGHAAAMALSMGLLVVIVLTGVAGFIPGTGDWTKTLFQWLGSAFTLVAGVAIGQGVSKNDNSED